MRNVKIKFDDYVNMVRSRAHFYARCYKMDYADIEAQGFLIYCFSLESYKKKKASFSTYLYQNLSGYLLAYCKQQREKTSQEMFLEDAYFSEMKSAVNNSIDDNISFDIFSAREDGPTMEQFLQYANDYLTPIAYNILEWLLNDRLEGLRFKKKPSLRIISNALLISLEKIETAWQEISDFWNIKGFAFYSTN